MDEENASITSRNAPTKPQVKPTPRHQDTFHAVYFGEHVERTRTRLSNLGKLQVSDPFRLAPESPHTPHDES